MRILFVFLEKLINVLGATLFEMGPKGRYNLYFEVLKGLLLKKRLNFFWFLQKMSGYYTGT